MPQYRHYRLDGTDSIVKAEWIVADDDESALRQARERGLPVHSEVWEGARRIGRVEALGKEATE